MTHSPPVPTASTSVVEIALVNNMPDQALAATEAQFARLVRAHAGTTEIRWRSYALPGVKRGEMAERYLQRTHEPIETLFSRGADALIVTGAEPLAADLRDEAYWPAMTQLVDWARENTVSTIWSCLAAHAAVLHLDGIERCRATQKINGVFACQETGDDWAIASGEGELLVPHSRYNDLPEEKLARRAYQISSVGDGVGVNAFWRREPSLFVFLQGHPEYDADSLLKEYRRDAMRFFDGVRPDFPSAPANYFEAETLEQLDALRSRVLAGTGVADPARELMQILSRENCAALWRRDTSHLFREWLNVVAHDRLWQRSA
jgi:homoserine O-succinyltransferase